MAKKSIARKVKYRNDLSAKFVRLILDYNKKTGKLYWKMRYDVGKPTSWAVQYAGKEAGKFDPKRGYVFIGINGKVYLAHRVIWLWCKGRWPKKELDHQDTIKTNNRIKNLRESTRAGNVQNTGLKSNNTSGKKGATWHKKIKKWSAQIGSAGPNKHIGYFDTVEKAHAAHMQEAKKRFKQFARAG